MRILVVDDSSTMRRIIVSTLHRIGFLDCVEAVDGRDALAKFDASISVVITDWNMPVMTGTELARALRSAGHVVPILMVTARSVRAEMEEARAAGMSGYIVKPFTPQLLKQKLDSLLPVAAAPIAAASMATA
jgi:two-component system, chemotaxis family, chemotaxis protein CheY